MSAHERLEVLEQRTTHLLQEIDANFVKSHETASKLLYHVQKFTQHTHSIHESLKIWGQFFASFYDSHAEQPSFLSDSSLSKSLDTPQKGTGGDAYGTPNAGILKNLSNISPSLSSPSLSSPPISTPFLPPKHKGGAVDPYRENERSGMSTPSLGSPPISTPFLKGKKRHIDQNESKESDLDETPQLSGSPLRSTAPVAGKLGFGSPEGSGAAAPTTPSVNPVTDLPKTPKLDSPLLSTKLEGEVDDKMPAASQKAGDARVLDLAVFPPIFREGAGADQLRAVYAFFRPGSPATLADVTAALPSSIGEAKIRLFLDELTRRRFLRAQIRNNEMIWQL